MRKIRIIEQISLDGVIQAPGGPDEDREGNFEYGGWAMPHIDPAAMEAIDAAHGETFDLLLGRHTYDIWAGYWPKQNNPMADSLNAATKYVTTPQAGQSCMGSGRGPWAGHRRGRSPHQGIGRAAPDRLGQLDADTGAARTWACG
jgi:hypothetical protein